MSNRPIPVIGQGPPPKVPVQTVAGLFRSIDEDGWVQAESVVIDPNTGQPAAVVGRKGLVSGEDIVNMIVEKLAEILPDLVRSVIREELIHEYNSRQ